MPEPVARLTETSNGCTHELAVGVHVIGRDADADVSLTHPDVSRHHVELTITSEGAMLRDLDSKNGVTVDGHKLQAGALGSVARLRLGEFELVFEHLGDRIDQLIARSGELTVKRPRPPIVSEPPPARASLWAPGLAALVFALLLVGLLVFG